MPDPTSTTSAEESLWLATSPATEYPRLVGEVDADVAVVGGGIAGLTTALLLKRAGLRVVVLEAQRVGRGVTGCTTAKVSALQSTIYTTIVKRHGVDAATTYAAASLAGVQRIATLADEEGIDCHLARRDAITYAATMKQRADVEQEHRAARGAGLAVELVDTLDLPFRTFGAVRLAEQLQLHPVRYVQGLAAALDGDGAQVFEQSRVISAREASRSEVRTREGVVHADHVVVATHYPIFDRGLYFARLKAQRSYCIAARLASGLPPASMSISAGSPTRSVRSYGDMLVVGGEGHSAGAHAATPERYQRLETFAREHWDVAEITHRWSAQDPSHYDHLPVIGPYRPGSKRLWVTSGYMKWGLATATFGAELLTDLILGRSNPWAATFSPNRLSPRSLHETAELGIKFSADFVGDRVRRPDTRELADVPRGEARVVGRGRGRIGAFRDDDGTLHAVSMRCTHLGCLLRFNAAERSWDCPCHGSRFDVDGAVLEGPAVRDLPRPDL